MAIQYLDGFEKTGTVKLRPSVHDDYGMDRHSCSRALEQLEVAGLIRVVRKPGAAPVVAILKGKESPAPSACEKNPSDVQVAQLIRGQPPTRMSDLLRATRQPQPQPRHLSNTDSATA